MRIRLNIKWKLKLKLGVETEPAIQTESVTETIGVLGVRDRLRGKHQRGSGVRRGKIGGSYEETRSEGQGESFCLFFVFFSYHPVLPKSFSSYSLILASDNVRHEY